MLAVSLWGSCYHSLFIFMYKLLQGLSSHQPVIQAAKHKCVQSPSLDVTISKGNITKVFCNTQVMRMRLSVPLWEVQSPPPILQVSI